MQESGIYCIENIQNNKKYIGSAKDFKRRKELHFRSLRKNKHHSIYLQRAYNKYGAENFKFYILEQIEDEDKLLEREQYYFDAINPEYNVCKVAGSTLGRICSEETKKKLSLLNRGKKHTAETVAKIIAANKLKIGAKRSEESKKRMSDAQKELYKNGYINPKKGKKVSKKIIDMVTEKIKIPVIQCSKEGILIKEWNCGKNAAKELNLHAPNISACCKGKVKSAGGFIWKYKI